MVTQACPRKEKGKKCKRHVRFHPFHGRWRVGRSQFSSGLCRYAWGLALRAARVIEHAGRHVEFHFVRFGQTIIYAIFRMIASKLKGNVHDVIIF